MESYHDICFYFGVSKIGEITWAHAVTSQALLQRYLNDPEIMMIEGDVSISANGEIIMAHPPATTSDLTFHEWLHRIAESGKGAKLDIKVPEVVDVCLNELRLMGGVNAPVFVNADIFPGPGSQQCPFVPSEFVGEVGKCCAKGVLSIGWQTQPVPGAKYTVDMIDEALAVAEQWNGLVTFPVRVVYAAASFPQLQRLLENDRYSLTLWNNEELTETEMAFLRENTDSNKTMYDLITWPDKERVPFPL